MSYFAIRVGKRKTTFEKSFGFHRAEILGALASILIIWGLLVYLIIEAVRRCIVKEQVDGKQMLIFACVGLCFNLVEFFSVLRTQA